MPLTLLRHATQKPPTGTLALDLDHPLAQGLVFAPPWNEGAGTSSWEPAQRVSSSAWTGVFGNIPLWTSGRFGAALAVKGARIEYPALAVWNLQRFTMSAWLFIDPADSGQNRSLFCGSASSGYEYRINSSNVQELLNSSVASLGTSSSAPPTGVWTHVALSYDGTTVRFYLNGNADGTASGSATFSSYVSLALAMRQDGNEYPTQPGSLMDLPRMHNRVLAQAEIQQLMAEPMAVYAPRTLQRWLVVISGGTAATRDTSTRFNLAPPPFVAPDVASSTYRPAGWNSGWGR